MEEVKRLRALKESHMVQIHRLEEHLQAKRELIIHLEARLDTKQQYLESEQPNLIALKQHLRTVRDSDVHGEKSQDIEEEEDDYLTDTDESAVVTNKKTENNFSAENDQLIEKRLEKLSDIQTTVEEVHVKKEKE